MFLRVSYVLLFASVLLGGLVIWRWQSTGMPTEGAGRLLVRLPAAQLQELPLGPHEIVFQVSNPSNRSCRIVGGTEGCSGGFCLTLKERNPVAVAPGDSVDYAIELDLKRPGPFQFTFSLYLEEVHGLRTVEQRMSGVALPPTGSASGG